MFDFENVQLYPMYLWGNKFKDHMELLLLKNKENFYIRDFEKLKCNKT